MKTFPAHAGRTTARKRLRRRPRRKPRNRARTFASSRGGTTLIDLMKLNVETAAKTLIDINRLPLDKIEATSRRRPNDWCRRAQFGSGLAPARAQELRRSFRSDLERRDRCRFETWRRLPAICCSGRAACISATPRCRATSASPARVARAINGSESQLGDSRHERTLHRDQSIRHERGHGRARSDHSCARSERRARVFRLPTSTSCPANTPQRETVLEPGDLITHVTLPPPAPGNRSLYLKLRDRASYEFALASAAVVITAANGKITRARIALGGVGTKPWRSTEAEGELTDQPATKRVFRKAADAALRGAKPQSQNGFKVELAKRCLVHALKLVTQPA